MTPITVTITVAPGVAGTACDLLSGASGLSKSRIKRAMNCGAVWLQRRAQKQRRLRRASFKPLPGDRLALYYDARILNLKPLPADCIADRKRYSVWNKPPGVMSQGTQFGDHCALTFQVRRHFTPNRDVYLIHRLDREAAGLVMLAHDRQCAGLLSNLLQVRQVKKEYRIEVHGDLSAYGSEGQIDLPLDGKPAATTYALRHYDPQYDISHVDAWLLTGRLHQIRRHFDMIGHPVMGDPRYGRRNKNDIGLRLTATAISLTCPVDKKRISFRIQPFTGVERATGRF